MNILGGNIKSVQSNGQLSLVKVFVGDIELQTVVLEKPESLSYLKMDASVKILFKETEAILSKAKLESSLVNQISGVIESIDRGEILSKVLVKTLIGKVVSIVTTETIQILSLKQRDQIWVMINTNEIMLAE